MHILLGRTAAAAIAIGCAVPAAAATFTGTFNGMTYTATNRIVGTTSTATVAGGGDPRFFANSPFYNGTVALIMQTAGGNFICSGSLMADRRSILTAAHCVSGGAGTANPIATSAFFFDGANPDHLMTSAGSTRVGVSDYFVNAGYTGQVIDQNDIAVLRLSELAPDFARSYDLYDGDASGMDFNVTGVGGRSTVGGSAGRNLGTGIRRQGDNRFDFALGDDGINGGFDFLSEGDAQIDNVLLADFDSGLFANDASCLTTLAIGVTSGRYCNLGRGAGEALTAGGDSGGASFIDGRIAGVTSFGLSFGTNYGDVDGNLNSSFGEFGGFVSTSFHSGWINSVLAPVPEPESWAMMIAGFGLVGFAMRGSRRQPRAVAA